MPEPSYQSQLPVPATFYTIQLAMAPNSSIDLWMTPSKHIQRVADLIINEDLYKEEALERERLIGAVQQSPTRRILHDDPKPDYAFHDLFGAPCWISNYIDFADTDASHATAINTTQSKVTVPVHDADVSAETSRYEEQEAEAETQVKSQPKTEQATPSPPNVRNRSQRSSQNR